MNPDSVGTSVCPACASAGGGASMTVREVMFGLDADFAYARCDACGTVWLLDVPADMGAYYPEDYYSIDLDPEQVLGRPGVRTFAASVARSVLFGERRLARAALAAVPMRQFHTYVRMLDAIAFAGLPAGRQTRILDVGCGSGYMIYALSLAGVTSPIGIDPFAPADRAFGTGARLLRRDLAEVEGTFDLIMYHHSFEHVPAPSESLEAAADLLAPGGKILVRMPTVSSAAFEKFGTSWIQLDAPRHFTIFSRDGMELLAKRAGLVVDGVLDDSSGFQFWGSEQVAHGISLMAPNSHMVSPKDSMFGKDQLRAWEAEAEALNSRGQGDQAAWLLSRG